MIRLFLPAVLFFSSAVATAQAPSPPREVEIEVRDQDQGRSEVARFRLAVSGSGAAARIASTVADARYEVKLRHDQPGTTSYALELERHGVSGRVPKLDLQVVSARVLRAGQREVVSLVERPDGSRTEVALILRP